MIPTLWIAIIEYFILNEYISLTYDHLVIIRNGLNIIEIDIPYGIHHKCKYFILRLSRTGKYLADEIEVNTSKNY